MTEILLTKGYSTIIDDDCHDDIRLAKWCANVTAGGHVYAMRSIKGKSVYLHRLLAGAKPGQLVDHADGNTLNNCRGNLRLCTAAENVRNGRSQIYSASRYRGVFAAENRWQSSITKNGVKTYLGLFNSESAAAAIYNLHAATMFGSFARLNTLKYQQEIIAALSKIDQLKDQLLSAQIELKAICDREESIA